MRLATAEQIRSIDSRAQSEYGMLAASLMETAGLNGWNALARFCCDSGRVPAPSSISVVAGKGNNGGDALVMGRCAARSGWSVTVILAASENSFGELPSMHLATLRKMGVPVLRWPQDANEVRSQFSRSDVILDGITGSGISGALRAPADELAELLGRQAALRVAVDVPSGVSDTWMPGFPVAASDVTLSMGLPQKSLYEPSLRGFCGTILHVDVGFPLPLTGADSLPGELLSWESAGDLRKELLPLPLHAYKHSRGVVCVSAGQRGSLGAAMLSAAAVQHSRAGLVHLVVDDALYPAAAGNAGPVMVHPTSDWKRNALPCDAALVGPGWGTGTGRAIELSRLLSKYDRGVLDADALNLLSRGKPRELGGGWVMTPHVGELARVTSQSTEVVRARFIESALDAANDWKCVVVAKGQVVVIARPGGEFAVVDGLNPALGTGGSGDILAGIVAGLLAGHAGDSYSAARLAAVIHQEAGRRARADHGLFTANALLPYVARLVDYGT